MAISVVKLESVRIKNENNESTRSLWVTCGGKNTETLQQNTSSRER